MDALRRCPAQKILSAIPRASGRLFRGHFANLIIGQAAAAVKRHGHGLFPAFGAEKALNPAKWRSVVYRLHAAGLVTKDPENRGRWIVTETGRGVLLGNAPLTLTNSIELPREWASDLQRGLETLAQAEAEDPAAPRAARPAAPPETKLAALTARQHALLALLKAKRLETARRQKLPASVIFHDSMLNEMAVRCPATREELLQIPGIDASKAERFGAIFLSAIADFNRGL